MNGFARLGTWHGKCILAPLIKGPAHQAPTHFDPIHQRPSSPLIKDPAHQTPNGFAPIVIRRVPTHQTPRAGCPLGLTGSLVAATCILGFGQMWASAVGKVGVLKTVLLDLLAPHAPVLPAIVAASRTGAPWLSHPPETTRRHHHLMPFSFVNDCQAKQHHKLMQWWTRFLRSESILLPSSHKLKSS